MTFTLKNVSIETSYMLQGMVLKEVTLMKDLGGALDSRLAYKHHIQSVLGKARLNSGLIMRNSRNFSCSETLTVLYFGLVRSQRWSTQTLFSFQWGWGKKRR